MKPFPPKGAREGEDTSGSSCPLRRKDVRRTERGLSGTYRSLFYPETELRGILSIKIFPGGNATY
jgi:hypothetical protein